MVCSNCGKNLIRGYAFCLECGSPVPPEVLEEGGMPGRTDNEGRPSSDAENKSGEESGKSAAGTGAEIPGIEPIDGRENGETLVFCPNCGMHMQKDPYQCNKCGMKLGDKPKRVPMTASGVPLMNVDPLTNGLGGGLDGISESDLEQLSQFMSGSGNIPIFAAEEEAAPDLFGSSISANDFAALTEQLASFSASTSDIPVIDAASETEPAKHQENSESVVRKVDNFSMSDASAAPVPLADNGVPVIENHSMDDDLPSEADIDQYNFLNNKIGDSVPPAPVPETKPSEPRRASEPPKHSVPAVEKSVCDDAPEEKNKPEPEPAPSAPPIPEFLEEAPFIEEAAPFISEFVPEQANDSPKKEDSVPLVSAKHEKSEPPKQAPGNTHSDPILKPVMPSVQPPAQAAAKDDKADNEPRGNLFRCQYCGQAMYDTDKVCKNCGASYENGFSKPKKKSKALLYVGICAAVIVVMAVIMYFVILQQNNNPVVIPGSVAASSNEVPGNSAPGSAEDISSAIE